ncbi:hypothetical protein BLX41_15085 [Pseudomonas protegens]|nr:hypothetical protein BLX41_15085 [Pseudomonas protegens]
MLALLALWLLRRERRAQAQLRAYRKLAEGLPDDAERFKRSQYFVRIGTWDWEVDIQRLYWSEAIYGMFGFKVGKVLPSYELFCSCVHPDDRQRVRAGESRCLETGENHDEEYRVVWSDGSSLGVAVFPDHAGRMDQLLHVADLAMYEAKRSGNNQYRLGQ